jgi:hypothetical protein
MRRVLEQSDYQPAYGRVVDLPVASHTQAAGDVTSVVRLGPSSVGSEDRSAHLGQHASRGRCDAPRFNGAAIAAPTLLNGSNGSSGTSATVAINGANANGILEFVGNNNATSGLSVLACTEEYRSVESPAISQTIFGVKIGGLSTSQAPGHSWSSSSHYAELADVVNPQT